MRVVAQVFLGYFVLLLFATVWRLGPTPGAAPEIAALFAAYLGITARPRLAPAAVAAAIVGYLGDLLLGTPPGLQATCAAFICVIGYLVHRRLMVRGLFVTVLFASFIGLIATIAGFALRLYFDLESSGGTLGASLATILLTGLAGPIVFRLSRWLDRRFVRVTHLQSPVFD